MNDCRDLFRKLTGADASLIVPIENSGSNRKYFRMSDHSHSYIGVNGTSYEENRAFIALSNHFYRQGIPVPKVLIVSDDSMAYLQEDMGKTSLFDLIKSGRENGSFSIEEKELLAETIKLLPELQFKGAENLDFSVCFPQPEFDSRTILWDLNYFKYCFLKLTGIDFQEGLLEDDFNRFSAVLLQHSGDTFMYRDFQSRNVMIHNNKPYFIDFQGGRRGPIYYDVASFLWQAKANFPDSLREELLEVYIGSLKKYLPDVNTSEFKKQLRYFVLFRTIQVLGAYGFRGLIEKKAHFIESIPFALKNLRMLLNEEFPEFPYFSSLLKELVKMEIFQDNEKDLGLVVSINSFSYKKGIPEDYSGNGGGYVFDCRAIHNPGKYQEYKKLTGLDQPVIEFLEKESEMLSFMEPVYQLANKHIEQYLKRGFTRLMFSFGCTGGQHRSVYAAQHLAEYLTKKYPVKVKLEHREQRITSEWANSKLF